MIVTTRQAAAIRAGKITFALAPISHLPRYRIGGIRKLRRLRIDADTGQRQTITITDHAPGEEPRPVVITILNLGTEIHLDQIPLADARRAGHRTHDDLRSTWRDLYPHATPHAITIQFALGDLRDAPRLLSASMTRGDYTETPALAIRDEPEALSDDQLIALTRFTTAKNDARKREPLATHAINMARELDEIRTRIPEEGLDDRSTRKTLRAMEYHMDELKRKLNTA